MATLIGDVYQVKFFLKLAPQFGINIRHFQITAQTAPFTETDFANAISKHFASRYKPLMGMISTYFGISTQKGVAGSWVPQAVSSHSRGLGLAAGETLPAQATGLITLRDGMPGRAGRGRIYVPFPTEDHNVSGVGLPSPNVAYVGLLNNLGLQMTTSVIQHVDVPAHTAQLEGQIWHRGTGFFTEILEFTSQVKWATQKRRGSYGRTNQDPF